MKKVMKAVLFCAAAAGFIPYDLRKTEDGEVQSRSLFLEIRKKEAPDGETQVQVSFPMIDQLGDLGRKISQRAKAAAEGFAADPACAEDAEYVPAEEETPEAEAPAAEEAPVAEEAPAEPCPCEGECPAEAL